MPKSSKKYFSKIHFFDAIIILFLLNVIAVVTIIFYIQEINNYRLPYIDEKLREVKGVPLSFDLESINASAEAYVVYDIKARTVVAGKNERLRFSPASTAKVMSAIIALEHYDPEEYLRVPDSIYLVLGSKMNLVPGEELKVRDLLYGMMLPSGNDASYTLAYHYPNGVSGFVRAMNLKAKELRLTNTYFVDPAGYEDGNYTTASELARLGAYAMGNPVFAEIVRTREYFANNKTQTHPFVLSNLNELLAYDSVIGIKTGFTNEAGGVLLTAIEDKNTVFVITVLKSENRFSDTQDLMDFIFEKIEFSNP